MNNHTKLYVSSAQSLSLLRLIRMDNNYILSSGGSLPAREEICSTTAALSSLLALEPFREYLHSPVSLRFPDATSRIRSSRVSPSGNLSRLPSDAFLEILTSKGSPLITTKNQVIHVYIESPAMAVLSASTMLGKKLLSQNLSKRAALIRLTALAMEFTGSYSREPDNPLDGEVVYNLAPVSNVTSMTELLAEMKGIHGIKLARQALSYTNNDSGSPMETLWYLIFCLPSYYGGLHMKRPLQNHPIAWPKGINEISCHQKIRPDFYWPQYRTACEYESKFHRNEEAFYEDRARARDYELCKIACLPITDRESQSNYAIKTFLNQLVSTIRPYADSAFRRKMTRLLSDPQLDNNREILLAQLHPGRVFRS